jgi:hypothetical protein
MSLTLAIGVSGDETVRFGRGDAGFTAGGCAAMVATRRKTPAGQSQAKVRISSSFHGRMLFLGTESALGLILDRIAE